MNDFQSVKQIQNNIDMQSECFNSFACNELEHYFEKRRCKLPFDPVTRFDEETFLNQRGAKVYFDSKKQPLLPLHEGTQTFKVLSVGLDQKFTPTVTILKEGLPICFSLPEELSEWACNVVGMAAMGMKFFPTEVNFTFNNGKYDVFILPNKQ